MTALTSVNFAANGSALTMSDALLFDTDVLIEYLRGREAAAKFFDAHQSRYWYVSTITIAELYAGVRPNEEEALRNFLALFEEVELDATVARRAGLYRNRHTRTHGTGLADAVVAASAETVGATLLTFNERHYPMIDDLIVPWSR